MNKISVSQFIIYFTSNEHDNNNKHSRHITKLLIQNIKCLKLNKRYVTSI